MAARLSSRMCCQRAAVPGEAIDAEGGAGARKGGGASALRPPWAGMQAWCTSGSGK